MRIWFFWTPHLASRVLEDILQEPSLEVVFVVTNPDKPVGREQLLKPTPVKEVAISHDIPVFTPVRIKENYEFLEELRSYVCDYFVVVAYGKILPKELLTLPRRMCINVHGSILPKYRGASPIQSALLHGEEETGVTIMQMTEGMDEGAILRIEKIPIVPNETSWSLFEKFEATSGKALIHAIKLYESGEIQPVSQNHGEATYCTKIEKEDGLVDWSCSAIKLYHKWQAYTPWPGIFTMYEGKRLLLEKVQIPNSEFRIPNSKKPGTVIKLENGSIGVVCGEWILTLEQVKLEWKKSQNIKDFVNGNQKFIWIII